MSHREKPWNRCDDCGKFIPLGDFVTGAASRKMTDVDSSFSAETYETLCKRHNDRPAKKEKA